MGLLIFGLEIKKNLPWNFNVKSEFLIFLVNLLFSFSSLYSISLTLFSNSPKIEYSSSSSAHELYAFSVALNYLLYLINERLSLNFDLEKSAKKAFLNCDHDFVIVYLSQM